MGRVLARTNEISCWHIIPRQLTKNRPCLLICPKTWNKTPGSYQYKVSKTLAVYHTAIATLCFISFCGHVETSMAGGQPGADPRMVRIGTGPPFWQVNHANSAYFRLFLGYFWFISNTRPPFWILPPPLFYISWIRPWSTNCTGSCRWYHT